VPSGHCQPGRHYVSYVRVQDGNNENRIVLGLVYCLIIHFIVYLQNRLETISMLIECGADMWLKNNAHMTAIHYACANDNRSVPLTYHQSGRL
jgi:ankyrin repeat protein